VERVFIFFIILGFSYTQKVSNSPLSINIPSGISLEISGKAEVEFVDVEGKGGAEHEEDFLKKIETRSPYAQIDKTVLQLKVIYSNEISYNFSLRFDDVGAYADKHFLEYKKDKTRIELGKNRPKIALKKDTEGYPLIGTAYWKGRQFHLDVEREISLFKVGYSIALKRIMDYDYAAEDKSFRMLVYDNTEKIDGQTIEYGVRAGLHTKIFKLDGWYFTGSLIDDEEWKKRLHYDFDFYEELEPDTVLSSNANVDSYWLGGRSELNIENIRFRAEYIFSKDGFLPRSGYYGEIGYNFNIPGINNKIFILGRYGVLQIDANRKAFPVSWSEDNYLAELKDPQTWDREMTTLALAYNLTDNVKIRAEYYILNETTGDTKIKADEENRRTQFSVEDDQLLVQLELNF